MSGKTSTVLSARPKPFESHSQTWFLARFYNQGDGRRSEPEPIETRREGREGNLEGETSSSGDVASRDMEHLCGVAAHDLFLILGWQICQLGMHVFLRLEANGANMWEVGAPQDAIRPD